MSSNGNTTGSGRTIVNAQLEKRGNEVLVGGCVCLVLGSAVMFWSLWFVLIYGLIFLIALVLGIVAMMQGRFRPGLALLLSSLLVPAILFETLMSSRMKDFKDDIREIAGKNSTDSKLELESYSCASEPTGGIRFILTGAVKNIGPKELFDVRAKGTYYDAHGKVIETADVQLNVDPLAPDQTATFRSYGPENHSVESCSIVFTNGSGAEIATVKK
jgi:hypothetical protein